MIDERIGGVPSISFSRLVQSAVKRSTKRPELGFTTSPPETVWRSCGNEEPPEQFV
jgi:hypothetical protein